MAERFWVELGNEIKNARILRRITQQELADRVGVTRNCIGNWETGRRKIDITELYKVCSSLNVDANEMLDKVRKYVY